MDMAQSRPTRLLPRVFPAILGILLAGAFASPGQAATYSEQTLYDLCADTGCADGATPWAGPILGTTPATAGTLYGTTSSGGANNAGTVFQIDTHGNYSVLYSFTGGTDGATPLGGLIMDSSGNLYGTTSDGGTPGCNYNSPLTGCGTVFQLAPPYTGPPTVLHTFGGYNASPQPDGSSPAAALIMGGGYLYGTASSGGANNTGAVFRLTSTGSGYSLLYSFCSQNSPLGSPPLSCTDGAYPMDFAGSLVMDASGNLYGTTGNGGDATSGGFDASAGTVFKLTNPNNSTTPWGITVLYNFCSSPGCTDGETPLAGLTMNGGNLYGTTNGGGANDAGNVFHLTSTGSSFKDLYDFCAQTNCTDGEYPIAGVTMDSSGNLYGTTEYGGANGFGAVFELPASGPEMVLFSFTGGLDGEYPYAGLTLDPTTGKLYGTTYQGGDTANDPSGGGTVFVLIPAAVALAPGQACNGTFDGAFNGNITVSAGSCVFVAPCEIKGNVTVNGGMFELLGCTVDGNLTENAGSITLGQGSAVGGNLQISGASSFSVTGGSVGGIGGNLQIQQVTSGQSPATVCGTKIGGNLQVQNNASPIVLGNLAGTCAGNTVKGNLQASNNTNTAALSIDYDTVGGNLQANNNSAALSIDYDTVGGNLQVQTNTPAATDVSDNKVTGNLQCQNNTKITEVGGSNSYHGNLQSSGNGAGNCTGTHLP
jgi:uncharacterized repeat protein (TIGR03803 family)